MGVGVEKYFMPKTLEEACSLLTTYKGEARVVSGGTDLVRLMRCGKVLPKCVINISGIGGQDYIRYDEKAGLRIGGQTTMHSIALSPVVRDRFELLATAAHTLGTPQVRGRATVAGNVCNASPSAETIPALMVLGASLRLVQKTGERVVPVEGFCLGPGLTVLDSREILAEITIPPLAPRTAAVYLSHRVREVLDLPIVSTAVMVTMDGGYIRSATIALGAVAPTPIRAKSAEALLKGKKLSESLIQEAAAAATKEAKPIDDVRSSALYRRTMVGVLVARAIRQAADQAVRK